MPSSASVRSTVRDFSQPTLRPKDEQPNAHATGDQPHVMGQEVLPLFKGGKCCILGDDLGGVILGWRDQGQSCRHGSGLGRRLAHLSTLVHVSGCGGRSSRPLLGRCHPEVSLNDLSQYLPMFSSDRLPDR